MQISNVLGTNFDMIRSRNGIYLDGDTNYKFWKITKLRALHLTKELASGLSAQASQRRSSQSSVHDSVGFLLVDWPVIRRESRFARIGSGTGNLWPELCNHKHGCWLICLPALPSVNSRHGEMRCGLRFWKRRCRDLPVGWLSRPMPWRLVMRVANWTRKHAHHLLMGNR